MKIIALLVITRHGQTPYNLNHLFSGQTDVPLTDAGRQEARQNAEQLKGISFDAAFASPAQRARETIQIILEVIGQADLPVTICEDLHERSWGYLEGKPGQDHADERSLCLDNIDYAPEQGETVRQVAQRQREVFHEHILPLLSSGKNVLVTSHSGSSATMMGYLEGIPVERWQEVKGLPTAGIAVYRVTADGIERLS